MIMRKLRLLTLSKVDPLPVLNYAHNCTTPLLSLISMIIMTMMIMTMTMTMMMKNCESVRPVLKRQHSKYPKKIALVLAARVAEFILVTVNITPTLAPPLNVALRQNSRFLRRNFLHFLRRTQRERERALSLCWERTNPPFLLKKFSMLGFWQLLYICLFLRKLSKLKRSGQTNLASLYIFHLI